uniref:Retrotransposon, putative, centromere-specific n=2 Tax=Oryza sativa subsp. japonica TaxID=39947 RepID=Q2R6T7_ORYSJ|nr:hypothetical protein LOC_Os11g18910 [Oryza sativa Japonica Group]ABA92728.1 retrotransposon, putative, centromere-specific [Oryza sativa Japonica Group]
MTRFFRGLNSDIQAGLINVTYNHIGHLFMLACSVESNILKNPREKQAMFVPPISDILQGAQNIHREEKRNIIEMPSPSITKEEEKTNALTLSEEGIKGKLNGADITQEELCDNASLKSMPQLVNEHAISSVSLCADFKHVVHIANDVEERKLITSLNTLGYVQFDDFCELNNLEEKLFAKSDLPCPTNAIFHIFGEYNDRGIYLVHRVFICSDLEKHVIANHTTSSFSSFDWMKQVILDGLCEEHHMEKPRTVFREEGEDDVTMATRDTTVAHIMDEQDDIKIKSSKCWNPIWPLATLLTSNGRRICMRHPFSAREYLMESSRSRLSNRSNLIAKFHLSEPQLKKNKVLRHL